MRAYLMASASPIPASVLLRLLPFAANEYGDALYSANGPDVLRGTYTFSNCWGIA